jgi:YD repeat-containing protein
MKFTGRISMIHPTVQHTSPVNEFQVDLSTGMFVLRQTDLFVPDITPLVLTRAYRVWDWDNYPFAFGKGANHSYDICPTATRNPYTLMYLNLEDATQIYFPRISKGTGYADAVYRHYATRSEFYEAQIAWNGDGWTLDFRDGRKFLFPEAYYSKSFAQGAATEMRDESGNRIQLKRDKVRNLAQLISPSGRTISFKYDDANRITEARDDAGNLRIYTYNSSGHLETVSDASGLLYRLGYEPLLRAQDYDPYLMTTVSDGGGRVLLRNVYDGSRVSEQELANGQRYLYKYLVDRKYKVVETIVRMPSAKVQHFFFRDGVPAGER